MAPRPAFFLSRHARLSCPRRVLLCGDMPVRVTILCLSFLCWLWENSVENNFVVQLLHVNDQRFHHHGSSSDAGKGLRWTYALTVFFFRWTYALNVFFFRWTLLWIVFFFFFFLIMCESRAYSQTKYGLAYPHPGLAYPPSGLALVGLIRMLRLLHGLPAAWPTPLHESWLTPLVRTRDENGCFLCPCSCFEKSTTSDNCQPSLRCVWHVTCVDTWTRKLWTRKVWTRTRATEKIFHENKTIYKGIGLPWLTDEFDA